MKRLELIIYLICSIIGANFLPVIIMLSGLLVFIFTQNKEVILTAYEVSSTIYSDYKGILLLCWFIQGNLIYLLVKDYVREKVMDKLRRADDSKIRCGMKYVKYIMLIIIAVMIVGGMLL